MSRLQEGENPKYFSELSHTPTELIVSGQRRGSQRGKRCCQLRFEMGGRVSEAGSYRRENVKYLIEFV